MMQLFTVIVLLADGMPFGKKPMYLECHTALTAVHGWTRWIMRIEKALALVVGEYNQCKDNPQIKKPVSYAVYQAWKWCDANEKERKRDEVDE